MSCNILTSRLKILGVPFVYWYIFSLPIFITLFVPYLCSFSTKESESKSQWKLCFKLYCLLDADSISVDSIEYLFLFEQVIEQSTNLQRAELSFETVFVQVTTPVVIMRFNLLSCIIHSFYFIGLLCFYSALINVLRAVIAIKRSA